MSVSEYFTSLDYLSQRRYVEKLKNLPDPYGIPEALWLDDVTKWPSIKFGDI